MPMCVGRRHSPSRFTAEIPSQQANPPTFVSTTGKRHRSERDEWLFVVLFDLSAGQTTNTSPAARCDVDPRYCIDGTSNTKVMRKVETPCYSESLHSQYVPITGT